MPTASYCTKRYPCRNNLGHAHRQELTCCIQLSSGLNRGKPCYISLSLVVRGLLCGIRSNGITRLTSDGRCVSEEPGHCLVPQSTAGKPRV